jgi:hypothetical protein
LSGGFYYRIETYFTIWSINSELSVFIPIIIGVELGRCVSIAANCGKVKVGRSPDADHSFGHVFARHLRYG